MASDSVETYTLGSYNLTYLGAGKYGKVFIARDKDGSKSPSIFKICWERDDTSLKDYLKGTEVTPPAISAPFSAQFATEKELLKDLTPRSVLPILLGFPQLRGLDIINMEYIGEKPPSPDIPAWIPVDKLPDPIPEPIALEIGKRFLTILQSLHNRGRYLIDAQIDNLRVRHATLNPSKPEDLELRILDWNGTNLTTASPFPYAVAHDIWFVHSFMFQMMTKVSIPERRSVTYEFLINAPNWTAISPGTQRLLRSVLSRPCGQVDLQDTTYLSSINSRLEACKSNGASLKVDTEQPSIQAVEDALWFAKQYNQTESINKMEQLKQKLDSRQARWTSAIDAYLNQRLGSAIDLFKADDLVDIALPLEELRLKLALTGIKNNLNYANSNDVSFLPELIGQLDTLLGENN
jgi:hypothetical protein